jgi:hypothetical protein
MKHIMKMILSILALLGIVVFINSCTTFKPQTGVWICDELGITVDFDDDEGLYGASMTARGTIEIDGETKEIVCLMDATGSCGFMFIEDMGKPNQMRYEFNTGYFDNKGKNKMTFKPNGIDKRYVFIRQE